MFDHSIKGIQKILKLIWLSFYLKKKKIHAQVGVFKTEIVRVSKHLTL